MGSRSRPQGSPSLEQDGRHVGHLELHRVAPWACAGPRRATVALDAASSPKEVPLSSALSTPRLGVNRRQVVAGATAFGANAVGAEAAWNQMVAAAAAAPETASLLPPGAIDEIEAGRVVVVRNWLPDAQVKALRDDAMATFAAGNFKADALASYGAKKKAGPNGVAFDPANDRMVMPSFYPSTGKDGPWVDQQVGNFATRQQFKARMAALKASLSKELQDRPTLIADGRQTHEMSYTRYGPGAFLPRHTDEHHGELKKVHPVASGDENLKRVTTANAATAPEKPKPTRRSVTWLVYLNDEWDAQSGGELRLHERKEPAISHVGARGKDLQVAWLRANATEGETPVFLDATLPGSRNCQLYACAADGSRRELSKEPFAASPTLFLAGGDFFARTLLVDAPEDQKRFHLLDAPKSAVSAFLPPVGPAGEDGGERVRDITPEGGTLVVFDSVSVPHEVLATRGRDRFACSGWFHEAVLS